MATDTGDRMKVVIYYAIWATMCAAVAGLVIAGLHTWLFSYMPTRSGLIFTLVGDAVTALAIGARPGPLARVQGSRRAQFGLSLQPTGPSALLLAGFDLPPDLLQWAVPATTLGWKQ